MSDDIEGRPESDRSYLPGPDDELEALGWRGFGWFAAIVLLLVGGIGGYLWNQQGWWPAESTPEPIPIVLSGSLDDNYIAGATEIEEACEAEGWQQATDDPRRNAEPQCDWFDLGTDERRFLSELYATHVTGEQCTETTDAAGNTVISVGEEILVRNEAGEIVGVGWTKPGLKSGQYFDFVQLGVADGAGPDFTVSVDCSLPFEIPIVGSAEFYTISIGRTPGPTYPAAILESLGWNLNLNRETG